MFELLDKTGEVVFRVYSEMKNVGLTRMTYHRKIKRFVEHGLLHKKKTGQSRVFVITAKAKTLRKQAITKTNRTDGMGTLIIFDIPEAKHNARDTLRRYLIRSGYTQIRESCFLSPFQMFDDLKNLIDELKLEKDISVFAAKAEYYFK